ncbi:hypothetical protein Srufu_007350 [Streptomyces libani subsp. rufus]|nr:hypothetical protein Srufu_007350 [Streptomyces libani subsp. rufus]
MLRLTKYTQVKPERAYGIHDAQINERGLHSVNGWPDEEAGGCYGWVPPGALLPCSGR